MFLDLIYKSTGFHLNPFFTIHHSNPTTLVLTNINTLATFYFKHLLPPPNIKMQFLTTTLAALVSFFAIAQGAAMPPLEAAVCP